MNSAIRRFFRHSLVSYKSMFSFVDIKLYITVKLLTPTFQMLFFCYVAKYVYNSVDMAAWVIGNSFVTCVFNIFLGTGLIMGLERDFGTLKILVATPTNRTVIFFSRSIIHILDAAYLVVFNLFIGSLVFKVNFQDTNIPLLALVIIICMFSAIALGMLVSAVGLVIRDIRLLMNIGIMAIITLSGANIPIQNLPLLLQKVSVLLPITRSIQAGRLLAQGGGWVEVSQLIFMEFLLGCALFFISFFVYELLEYQARKHSTLDVF